MKKLLLPLCLSGWGVAVLSAYWADNTFFGFGISPALTVLALLASAYLAGTLVVPSGDTAAALDIPLARILIGTGLMSLAVLALGWSGGLVRWAGPALLAAPFALLLSPSLRRRTAAGVTRPRPGAAAPRMGGLAAACLVVIVVFLALDFVHALAPPSFYDTLVYHLGLPGRWVMAGRIAVEENFFFSFMPLNTEMLYTLLLMTARDVIQPNLLNYAFGLLFLAGIAAIASRLYGRTEAVLAAGITAALPLFNNLMPVAKHDLSFAAFQAAALVMFLRWRSSGRPAWIGAAGLLAGMAIGVKYNGIYFAGSLAVLVVFDLYFRSTRPRITLSARLKVLALFGVAAAAVPAPYLVRNWLLAGNPVYPTLTSVFGFAPFQKTSMPSAVLDASIPAGLAVYLRLPWEMTMHSDRFGMVFGQIGFLLLALVPLALLDRKPPRGVGAVVFVMATTFLFWSRTSPQTRFFLFGLGLAAVLAARGTCVAWSRGGRVRALIGFVLVLGAAEGLLRMLQVETALFNPLPVVTGLKTRDEYLEAQVPYYAAARFANDNVGRGARLLLVGEARGFYLEIPYAASTGEDTAIIVRFIRESGSIEGLLSRLRAQGFTHVLVNGGELQRLAREYGYLDWDSAAQEEVYREFMTRHLRPVFVKGSTSVSEIVFDADAGAGAGSR